jgi:hypothetical protein
MDLHRTLHLIPSCCRFPKRSSLDPLVENDCLEPKSKTLLTTSERSLDLPGKVITSPFWRPDEAPTLILCWSGWIPATQGFSWKEKLTFPDSCFSLNPVLQASDLAGSGPQKCKTRQGRYIKERFRAALVPMHKPTRRTGALGLPAMPVSS